MPERSFSEDEVREILRRAVDRDAGQSGQLDRDRLVAAAEEIGIGAADVDHAIAEIERDRTLESELAALRLERRHEFVSSVSTFGIVNTGLLAIDWANGGGWWFYWPLTVWGMLLMLRYKGLLFKNETRDRKRAAQRLEARHEELARQVAKQRRKAKSRQLEAVIERGVDLLVAAAARHLEGDRRAARSPEPPPPPPPARSPRTRVGEASSEDEQPDGDFERAARRRRDPR
jgi:2TM domain-containing protein